jgi:hypothetical protein
MKLESFQITSGHSANNKAGIAAFGQPVRVFGQTGLNPDNARRGLPTA